MGIRFTKMHGAGNDYVYINGFDERADDPPALAVALSDRHFGVGGDGVVLILPSEIADARMRIFNADGSEAEMCGNAIRCVGKYVYERGICVQEVLCVETGSGVKTLYLTVENGEVTRVRVNMGAPILDAASIPVDYDGDTRLVPVSTSFSDVPLTCVSMGNPHAVLFTEGIDALDLARIGPLYERHERFSQGVNTEFIEVQDAHTLRMRVWERGSGETLACGTGACASVVAATLRGFVARGEDITVHLRGGSLTIRWDESTVWMTGGATIVFDGELSM